MSSDARRLRALALGIVVNAVLGLGAATLHAEGGDARGEAQVLFDRGLALLDAGDRERALALFLRSHALYPSKGNTANAAHCLQELGRYDEALDLYEELSARFADELGPEKRNRLVPTLRDLASRVGRLELAANVAGTLVVDGRPRGRVPLTAAVHVLGGRHVVRVLADGYATFERAVDVGAGETVSVDARLDPLAERGSLRVEAVGAEGATVVVDGAEVGVAPWEGTLGPGTHVVAVRGEERGSAPSAAVVVKGQAATVRLATAPLGGPVRIDVEPATAALSLDGVALGPGAFRGALPLGAHEASASEPGYLPRAASFVVTPDGGSAAHLRLALDVDAGHPRWPASPGRVELDALAGVALGATLAGDAASWCGGGCGAGAGPAVTGVLAGGRVGYRLPVGVAVELSAAYLGVASSLARSRSSAFQAARSAVPVTYALRDEVRLRGAIVTAGVGWRAPLGRVLGVGGRLGIGALVAGVTDPIDGEATTASGRAPVVVSERSEVLRTTALVIAPALELDARVGAVHVSAGAAVLGVVGAGPRLQHRLLEVDPSGCTTRSPTSPACAPATRLVAGERAHGSFALIVPTLTAGYAF